MNITHILLSLISGGVGGNIAGVFLKKYSLGPIGNTVVGLLGGVRAGKYSTSSWVVQGQGWGQTLLGLWLAAVS